MAGEEAEKKCPQGGCEYDDPPRRARKSEDMVENCELKRSCRSVGCNEEFKKEDLAVHEIQCSFRIVPCPRTSCQIEITFKDIELHIVENHEHTNTYNDPILETLINEEGLNSDNKNWGLIVLNENGVQFYPQFVKRNGLWYFWVKIKGDPVVAANWQFVAKIENVEKGIFMDVKGPVQPVDFSVEKILETGEYLLLNRQCVEKFMVPSEDQDVRDGFPFMLTISFKIT